MESDSSNFSSWSWASRLGSLLLFSHRLTVQSVTPKRCANSSWVSPRRCLRFLIWMPFIRLWPPLYPKIEFHLALYKYYAMKENRKKADGARSLQSGWTPCKICIIEISGRMERNDGENVDFYSRTLDGCGLFCFTDTLFSGVRIHKKPLIETIKGFLLVGAVRFELTTPCSQSRCASRTALRPEWC